MPTYEYECQSCHERLEAVQSFSDAPLNVCPACGGALRKVYSAVGIVFKGGGFYKTDARSSSTATVPASDTGAKSTPATPATPATPPPSTSSTTSD
jgi:putative FmdB family regulatory protein